MTWFLIALAVTGWAAAGWAYANRANGLVEAFTLDQLQTDAVAREADKVYLFNQKVEAAKRYVVAVGQLTPEIEDALHKELAALVGADAGAD